MFTAYFFFIQSTFLVSFIFLIFLPKNDMVNLKKLALIISYLIFFEVALLSFGAASTTFFSTPFFFSLNLIESSNFVLHYSVNVDILAYFFMLLTSFLIPLCVLSSWNNIKYKLKEFFICLILIEWILLNMFMAADLLIFYIWFEAILIPMYFLIGVWGSRQRKTYASFMFFFYTFLGSLSMLFALFLLYSDYSTLQLISVIGYNNFCDKRMLLWVLLFVTFAVKVPMFPAHVWLPEAHVEAPTVGSVLLAGILLKLGVFAIIRFLIPMFPYETQYFAPLVSVFALIGILYISLTTIRQTDLKKIIAYASIAHMNYVVLGVLSNNVLGFSGSIFLMIAHGIVSAGLFFLIGFLYDRYKTRNIRYYRGLITFMPLFGVSFLILTLANMSFPGTCNFVGEATILFGLVQQNILVAWISALAIVFCAIYSIWLFNRIMYGTITSTITNFSDLSKKEFVVVFPLLFLTIIFGIFPNFIFTPLQDLSYLTISYYN